MDFAPRLLPLCLGLGALVFAPACDQSDGDGDGDGSSQDDDGSNLGEGGESPCLSTSTDVTLDEELPGGRTAQDVADHAAGEHVSELRWAEDGELDEAHKGHVTPVTVSVALTGGARWVDREVDPEYDNGGLEADWAECEDYLELDVTVGFVTEDGEFNESGAAVLTSYDLTYSSLRLRMEPEQLAGSFDEASVFPDWVLNYLELSGQFGPDTAGGELAVEIQSPGDGPEGVVGFGFVASWGDQGIGE